MNAIRDLVSGTLGLVKERDQLVLESLPFEQTIAGGGLDEVAGPAAPAQPQSLLTNPRIYIGAGAGLALFFGALAVLLLKRRGKKAEFTEGPRTLTPVAAAEMVPDSAKKALDPHEQPVAVNHQLPPVAKKVEVVRDHLRDSVKRDPVFAANVLRGWLEEDVTKGRERSA
jgi:flagellar biosynthesis/type III secretory pathway M-ring protein FliF/YscJ